MEKRWIRERSFLHPCCKVRPHGFYLRHVLLTSAHTCFFKGLDYLSFTAHIALSLPFFARCDGARLEKTSADQGMLSLRSELCRRSRFAKVVISLGSGRHKESRKENDLSNCGRAPLAHKPTKCCRAGFHCHACLLTICWIPPKAFQNVQGAKFAIGFPNLPIQPNATSQAWSQTLWVPNTSWALLRHPWQSKDGRSITLHPHWLL